MEDLATYLKSIGFAIHIVPLVSNEYDRSLKSRIFNLQLFRFINLLWTIRRIKPEIVHGFDLESGIYSAAARMLLGVKKFKLLSGFGSGFVKDKRIRFLFQQNWLMPELFIGNSKKGVNELKAILRKPESVLLIRNGLDTVRLDAMVLIESNFEEKLKNNRVVGYIGKLDNVKHGERMLELAMEMLGEKGGHDKPLFVIMGDGPNRQAMEKKLAALPRSVQERVLVMGNVKHAGRLARYFDIGILCSDSEGYPNVLLEYMHFGIPWVSTDVGDVVEISDNGNTGFVLETWNAKEFAQTCTNILANEALCTKMSNEGPEIFNRKHSIETMSLNYVQVYNGLD